MRDILDPPSHCRSDASGLDAWSLDLLNPTIWYLYRGPAGCGCDRFSMEIPRRFHGDRFHGDSMVMCCWAPSGPEPPSPGLEPSSQAQSPLRTGLEASEPPMAALEPLLAASEPFQAASEPFQAASGHSQRLQGLSGISVRSSKTTPKLPKSLKSSKMDAYGTSRAENPSI